MDTTNRQTLLPIAMKNAPPEKKWKSRGQSHPSSHTAIIPRKRNGRETREGIAPKGNMTKEVIQGNEL
jgi:hypothetical protein